MTLFYISRIAKTRDRVVKNPIIFDNSVPCFSLILLPTVTSSITPSTLETNYTTNNIEVYSDYPLKDDTI